MLRCRNCTATFAFLQCGGDLYQKLRCNKRKTALQHRNRCVAGFPALSCGFQAPTLGTHVSDLLMKTLPLRDPFRDPLRGRFPSQRLWVLLPLFICPLSSLRYEFRIIVCTLQRRWRERRMGDPYRLSKFIAEIIRK